MTTKKSLIAIAAMALSLMGFASTATAATDGVIRDVTTNGIITTLDELHGIGWAKFSSGFGNFECHVTSNIIPTVGGTGTTGEVTSFTIPNTANCTGSGALAGCTLASHTVTNLPWHATVTPPVAGSNPAGDLDITDFNNIVLDNGFSGGFFCPASLTLTFTAITLKPLRTGGSNITGGSNNVLGAGTAALNDPIAGVEISGSGTSNLGSVTATGELQLTSPGRCTWKIAAS